MTNRQPLFRYRWALFLALFAACVHAQAQVDVEIVGDTAYATIELEDGGGNVYAADVTIQFDTPINLSAESLNLSAELVDPSDPALLARLPAGVTVDPDFPLLVTVEPSAYPWLFVNGFENGLPDPDGLSFRNSYQFEVHTHNLIYVPNSPYRLMKAPQGGAFADITEDVRSGSTRARGRGGAFSQFIVAKNTQPHLFVALAKVLALDARLLTAVLSDPLRLDLVGLLIQVQTALLVPVIGCLNAIAPLDQFIDKVNQNAGINIANLWRAEGDLVNDAGELQSLAYTLRFSVLSCSGNP
jgi:hypothetical protein